jgi:hypothetical protein
MLFCISPVGTAALLNFFAAIAVDYRATPGVVALVNGALNGLITAVGALAGGWLSTRCLLRQETLRSPMSAGSTLGFITSMVRARCLASTPEPRRRPDPRLGRRVRLPAAGDW